MSAFEEMRETPPLIEAISQGNEARVQEEVSRKTTVEMPSGATTLHFTAQTNNKRIIKLLVDEGATIDAKDDREQNPLDYAI
jgi:hypothetical protein